MGGEDHFDGVPVGINVEGAVCIEILQEVDRCKVARRVIDVHVLRAWVRPVDTVGCCCCMPTIDRGIELETRVGAFPRSFCYLTPHVTGFHRLDDLTCHHSYEAPVGIVNNCLHEFVGNTN